MFILVHNSKALESDIKFHKTEKKGGGRKNQKSVKENEINFPWRC